MPLGRVLSTVQVVTTSSYRYQSIGIPTLVTDLPTTGTTTYAIRYICTLLSGTNVSASDDIAATMTVNHATGAVAVILPNTSQSCFTNGSVVRPASLLFAGTLNNTTNRITGTITSPDSTFSGTFTGQLFGPAGIETGLVFAVRNGTDAFVAGQILGRRG